MRRFIKWIGFAVAIPLGIMVLAAVALYLPPMQDFVVGRLTKYASEQTGMDITVGRLHLSPIADLRLDGLTAIDSEGDTVIAARKATIDLRFKDIFKKRIGIEGLALDGAKVNTKQIVAEADIRGTLDHIELHDDVDLGLKHVSLDKIAARGLHLDIALRDTIVEDTTESKPLRWTATVRKTSIEDAHIRFATAGDSLAVKADADLLQLDEAAIDLGRQHYKASQALLKGTLRNLQGAGVLEDIADGMPLTLKLRDIDFDGERQRLSLPYVDLSTPSSHFKGGTDIDLTAFTPGGSGALDINFETDLSKADIISIAGKQLPDGFGKAYPDELLHVKASAHGNLEHLTLHKIEATLPGSLTIDGRGDLIGLTDSTDIQADIDYNLEAKNINWVRGLAAGALDEVRLPQMSMAGNLKIDGTRYSTLSRLTQAGGTATIRADIDTQADITYEADIRTAGLQLRNFVPAVPLTPLTAHATLAGHGTDIYSHLTRIDATAEIASLSYEKINLSHTTLTAQLHNGRGKAKVTANNPSLAMQADLDGLINFRNATNAKGRKTPLSDLTFSVDLSRADLQQLGLVDKPLKVAMCTHLDGTTDLISRHQLSGIISDIALQTADTLFHPDDITFDALLRPDTTFAHITSGDLTLTTHSQTAYDRLATQLQHFADEASRQAQERRIDMEYLKKRLPAMDLHLAAKQHNPVHDILSTMGYSFETANLDMRLDPHSGINGGGHVHSLNTGTILLDTINFHAHQSDEGIALDARVHNGRRNPQISFDARLNANVSNDGQAGANLQFFDERGRKGIDLGLLAAVHNDSLNIHFDPLNPVIAYRSFHLNSDNYLRLGKKNRVTANINLLADDGTGLKLYSADDFEALQDLTVSVNHFNLGELMTVIPYMPRLTGYLHGDAHLIQTEEHISVSTDMTIDDLTYEGAALGQIGLEGVYLPNSDGSHFVDGSLLQTGMPVASFSGTYTPKGSSDLLDIDATLERLPLSLANGFIPDGLATLSGVALGSLHVGGSTKTPLINGAIATSDMRIASAPYSLSLRVADDTLRFSNSLLSFNNIKIFSTGNNPLTLDGDINLANTDKIGVNATLTANNFELINAKKTSQAVAYGKVYVDLNTMLRGTLDNLNMYGRLQVLGNTDLTYVLTDSPLTVEDQLADLVEFVDFEDTLAVATQPAERPQNIRITMNVGIDDAAQAHCLLSADASSYVDLEGGGDLTLTYSPEKDLQLNGRYTINSGTIKYTMMVIPLKEFVIKSGSYVEFRGPIDNPTLNLSATERIRTTITENQQPRSVNFDVGMNITQTLEDLGLEFTLDAPEDLSVRNELAAMSTEQRGRVAVTMLATGMYLTDANSTTSGGFSTQNALNAFLQSQISNITNKALKSVDLSLGMEQGTSATGSTTTDYSFRFAKRFWGNRIGVIVGGKVSTGDDAQNIGQSLIDNVSIEYRLDKSASRYVKVYYDKKYESLLESEITEMGAGLVLRRKTTRLGELFLFRKNEEKENGK